MIMNLLHIPRNVYFKLITVVFRLNRYYSIVRKRHGQLITKTIEGKNVLESV